MAHAESSACPRLVLTSGEPAGIGPEQILQLAQKPWAIEWFVLADATQMQTLSQTLGLPVDIVTFDPQLPPSPNRAGVLKLMPLSLANPARPGQLDPANAPFVLEQLTLATDLCLQGQCDAMVTAPIHKGVINEAGIPFSGHTEFFAERAKVDSVVMMLATPGLRVPLVTTHLPLKDVPQAITPQRLKRVITTLHQALKQQFGRPKPCIYVMGLNPHAGESGHMGTEEIETITPVLEQFREQGMDLVGPLPADTIFHPQNMKQADAFLAMYHDQGLPVLKYVGFGQGVNVTLGLPFVRTSVDHGTALDLAGQGQADINSFEYAITVAQQMTQPHERNA